jgi:AraC-like DNA-binding protein
MIEIPLNRRVENCMEADFSQLNAFLKQLADFRESVDIAGFCITPQIAHASLMMPHEASEIHEQRTFEVSLLLAGEMTYCIGNKDVNIKPGDVVIIPPRLKHYWLVKEKASEVFSFMIDVSPSDDNAKHDLSLLLDAIKNHRYYLRKFSFFENIIQEVIVEAVEQKTACREKVIYLIRVAFAELIRELLPDFSKNNISHTFPSAREDAYKNIVEIINYYIQDNIGHPISLKEISKHIGLSIGHLSSIYKHETGTTINQAIINKKMVTACRYLKQTDRTIKDIATLTGYYSVNYFYLQFKKKYGITPSQYRHAGMRTVLRTHH